MEDCALLLAGNPNSGKSTLFNRLCGARRQTGNFAGVTVDSQTGRFRHKGKLYSVADLPGVYSLVPATATNASPPIICLRIRASSSTFWMRAIWKGAFC